MSMTSAVRACKLLCPTLPLQVPSSPDFIQVISCPSYFASIVRSSHLRNVLCAAHSALRFLTPAEASACPEITITRQGCNSAAMQCPIITTNTSISSVKETPLRHISNLSIKQLQQKVEVVFSLPQQSYLCFKQILSIISNCQHFCKEIPAQD